MSDQGQVEVDAVLAGRLDELGVGYKTARRDRPSAIFVPETEEYGQQKLGMTRSLGDYYMHYHGACAVPAVSCIDLHDIGGQLSRVTLVLASDGLWDLWTYKDILAYPINASEQGGTPVCNLLSSMMDLFVSTRSEGPIQSQPALRPRVASRPPQAPTHQAGAAIASLTGNDMFGESADNITAIAVSFNMSSG